jgi:hypothetical protein
MMGTDAKRYHSCCTENVRRVTALLMKASGLSFTVDCSARRTLSLCGARIRELSSYSADRFLILALSPTSAVPNSPSLHYLNNHCLLADAAGSVYAGRRVDQGTHLAIEKGLSLSQGCMQPTTSLTAGRE